jgi:nitroimidazol reductase NimA-like FMN-containing flavoprotein (pyridoxamine 5'-phosphate oxidase superfamily)
MTHEHDTGETRGRVAGVLESQRLGVLATSKDDVPYQSLVAFAPTGNLNGLVFATCRSTRKYGNLAANPHVALMINSATNAESDFHQAVAVTAIGDAREVGTDEEPSLRELYLARHPYLEDFLRSPDCVLFHVAIRTYHVVHEFQKVMRLDLEG